MVLLSYLLVVLIILSNLRFIVSLFILVLCCIIYELSDINLFRGRRCLLNGRLLTLIVG